MRTLDTSNTTLTHGFPEQTCIYTRTRTFSYMYIGICIINLLYTPRFVVLESPFFNNSKYNINNTMKEKQTNINILINRSSSSNDNNNNNTTATTTTTTTTTTSISVCYTMQRTSIHVLKLAMLAITFIAPFI